VKGRFSGLEAARYAQKKWDARKTCKIATDPGWRKKLPVYRILSTCVIKKVQSLRRDTNRESFNAGLNFCSASRD